MQRDKRSRESRAPPALSGCGGEYPQNCRRRRACPQPGADGTASSANPSVLPAAALHQRHGYRWMLPQGRQDSKGPQRGHTANTTDECPGARLTAAQSIRLDTPKPVPQAKRARSTAAGLGSSLGCHAAHS